MKSTAPNDKPHALPFPQFINQVLPPGNMWQHLRHSPLHSAVIPGPAIYIIPMLNQCLQMGTCQMSAIKSKTKASDDTAPNNSQCILSTGMEKQMLLYWELLVHGCHCGCQNIMAPQSIMKVMDSVIIKMNSDTLSHQIQYNSWRPFFIVMRILGKDAGLRVWDANG